MRDQVAGVEVRGDCFNSPSGSTPATAVGCSFYFIFHATSHVDAEFPSMQQLRVAVIAGDGIGPEVIDSAIEVTEQAISNTLVRIEWTRFPWNSNYYHEHGRMMPVDGIHQLRAFDAILLGAIGSPTLQDHVTLNGLLLPIRRHFDQYVCVRPAFLYEGVESPLRNYRAGQIDMLVFRENTEGEYANIGGRLYESQDQEVAVQTAIYTRRGCRRIMEAAFHAARKRRFKVTSITKSNAQGYGMVLWDEVFRSVSAQFGDVETNSLLIDAAAMEFVRRPDRFDVVVASNLFGDILTDLGAAIVGSMGLAPSGNINPERAAPSMFEPVHGSAPDIAGQGIANPLAAVLSAAMMLDHLGVSQPARAIENAVRNVLRARHPRTPDLGGTSKTVDVSRALMQQLAK
jgi:tartrate dehydrogenase/decarboxylase/D-malate dehydrogenase